MKMLLWTAQKSIYKSYGVEVRFSEISLDLNWGKPYFSVDIYLKMTKSNDENYRANYNNIVKDLCVEFERIAKTKGIEIQFIEDSVDYIPQTPYIDVVLDEILFCNCKICQ